MPYFKRTFSSRYLQVSDLDPGPMTLTIARVTEESVGEHGDLKLVVRFREHRRDLVCNLTRAQAIAEIAGSEDTDNWPNTRITLVKGATEYQGKSVSCIVVQAPSELQTEIDGAVPF